MTNIKLNLKPQEDNNQEAKTDNKKNKKLLKIIIIVAVILALIGIIVVVELISKENSTKLAKDHIFYSEDLKAESDFKKWINNSLDIKTTPYYIVIKDGKAIGSFHGNISVDEFSERLETLLEQPNGAIAVPKVEITDLDEKTYIASDVLTNHKDYTILEYTQYGCASCDSQDENYTDDIYKKYNAHNFYRYYSSVTDKADILKAHNMEDTSPKNTTDEHNHEGVSIDDISVEEKAQILNEDIKVDMNRSHVYYDTNGKSEFNQWINNDLNLNVYPSYFIIKNGNIIGIINGQLTLDRFTAELNDVLAKNETIATLPANMEITNINNETTTIGTLFNENDTDFKILEYHMTECVSCVLQDKSNTADIFNSYDKNKFYRFYPNTEDINKLLNKYQQ